MDALKTLIEGLSQQTATMQASTDRRFDAAEERLVAIESGAFGNGQDPRTRPYDYPSFYSPSPYMSHHPGQHYVPPTRLTKIDFPRFDGADVELIELPNLHAQDDQAGFISLDCGRPNGYTDRDTGLRYTSDNDFIDTGVSRMVAPEYQSNSTYQQFLYVRSFPKGTRNCYTLKTTFLIRGRFLYANYDNNNHSLPSFDLEIGVDLWDTVQIYNESRPVDKEIIYVPKSDFIQVCLINTNSGIPFISALEIRPFSDDNIYKTDYSLKFRGRWDLGSSNVDWYSNRLTTEFPMTINNYMLPYLVINSANSPQNPNDSMVITWSPYNISDQLYVYLHFAELTPLASREFDIYINGKLFQTSYSPKFLQIETIVVPLIDVSSTYAFSLIRTKNSLLPPLLNAYEVYAIMKARNTQTSDTDVAAIMGIKSTYKVLKNNWQGDPCGPQPFIWDGIKCSYNPPQIISLNLSSSGLTGEISPFIQNLTSLQTLDLSNNNLSGDVPVFLSQFSSLRVLNLKGNNLTCPMPSSLHANIKNLISDDCKENSTPPRKHVIVIAASIGGFILIIAAASILLYCIKRNTRQPTVQSPRIKLNNFQIKNCQFSYSEILNITNNFQTVLGKGGFGTVYRGYVGNTPVAVKMLSESSTQSYKEFQAEAKFLVSVNHKNLTSVVGYCDQDDKMGLVYEFMEKGNLETNLSEKSSQILNWEERLRIAVDAAQGLEYLHNGCMPIIIHRDVKSSNILLNGKFEAKMADFGLSKTIPVEGNNYVSTVVVGTPGYVDPEYYMTNRVTEKSDVYGFGIVLLEIVTGKSAVSRRQGDAHIIEWVDEMISTADANQIADNRLRGEFDTNCLWKLVELAMACVSRESVRRPNMTQVVMELKDCLASEIARHDTRSMGSVSGGFMSMGLVSNGQLTGPLAR
ncbi:probable LRR receptor-like serine/threonine-protein kinase At1g05700 [Impatiens glandulifera]|uniref:probable LRR receptor-like serine/threonine-protein kinase At1g05700 n=1 Tax=Impatiens glandulifera TaxID=253017 RepID=UPI001FB0A315|nr:probable LRR receptor-like serine/threonine-protein kinase At1g05700 [Impatiens glandulifera]